MLCGREQAFRTAARRSRWGTTPSRSALWTQVLGVNPRRGRGHVAHGEAVGAGAEVQIHFSPRSRRHQQLLLPIFLNTLMSARKMSPRGWGDCNRFLVPRLARCGLFSLGPPGLRRRARSHGQTATKCRNSRELKLGGGIWGYIERRGG